MVHGGGHHHHHAGGGPSFSASSGPSRHHHHSRGGGGGDWGGSPRWNNGRWGYGGGGWDWGWNNQWNIGMNSNRNYFPQQAGYPSAGSWWGGGWGNQWNNGMNYSYSPNYPQQRHYASATNQEYSPEAGCGRCCRNCCLACGTCWIASFVAQQQKCGPMIQWTVLSICVFVLLIFMSSMDETWTFNGGETRHVSARGALTRQVEIQSQVANAFVVYDVHGHCPPLTGPTVPLVESWSIHLAPDDYQFDFYYLTQDSSLRVDFQQHEGATNISILKGTDALNKVQEGEDYPEFSAQALLTRYSAAPSSCHHSGKCAHGGQASSPTSIAYTVPETNVYIIVYDNASSSSGDANATIHVALATYDLSKQAPYGACQALTCAVDTRRDQCLLLQAPQEVGVVTLHIQGERRWLVITGMALIPILIGLGLQVSQRRETSNVGDVAASAGTTDADAPTAPPAINPDAQQDPQPVDAFAVTDDNTMVDYESIPIVAAEYITPVAVPVDDKP